MPFCEKCGTRQIKEWTDRFNSETGKKEYRFICSIDPCGHGLHDEEITTSCNPFKPDCICKRCGKSSYLDD